MISRFAETVVRDLIFVLAETRSAVLYLMILDPARSYYLSAVLPVSGHKLVSACTLRMYCGI